jgi:hypothetical protein
MDYSTSLIKKEKKDKFDNIKSKLKLIKKVLFCKKFLFIEIEDKTKKDGVYEIDLKIDFKNLSYYDMYHISKAIENSVIENAKADTLAKELLDGLNIETE